MLRNVGNQITPQFLSSSSSWSDPSGAPAGCVNLQSSTVRGLTWAMVALTFAKPFHIMSVRQLHHYCYLRIDKFQFRFTTIIFCKSLIRVQYYECKANSLTLLRRIVIWHTLHRLQRYMYQYSSQVIKLVALIKGLISRETFKILSKSKMIFCSQRQKDLLPQWLFCTT